MSAALYHLPPIDPRFTDHQDFNARMRSDENPAAEELHDAHCRLLDARDRINITHAGHAVFALELTARMPQGARAGEQMAQLADVLSGRAVEGAAVVFPDPRRQRLSAFVLMACVPHFHRCYDAALLLRDGWQSPAAATLLDRGRHTTAARTFRQHGVNEGRIRPYQAGLGAPTAA